MDITCRMRTLLHYRRTSALPGLYRAALRSARSRRYAPAYGSRLNVVEAQSTALFLLRKNNRLQNKKYRGHPARYLPLSSGRDMLFYCADCLDPGRLMSGAGPAAAGCFLSGRTSSTLQRDCMELFSNPRAIPVTLTLPGIVPGVADIIFIAVPAGRRRPDERPDHRWNPSM